MKTTRGTAGEIRIPGWLASAGGAPAARLREFIAEFCPDGVQDYREWDVGKFDFFPAMGDGARFRPETLEWSGFAASKDSYFYSRLLEEAIRRYGKTHVFFDLGTGSAIPLLSVFARGVPLERFRAEAYDVDAEAVATAARNVRAAGLENAIRVGRLSIADFFSERNPRSLEGSVVCANPPYVPCAKTPPPERFLAVAGGPDGLEYTRPFLDARYPENARLVLEWSSLADPLAVLAAIRRRFRVEYLQAAEVALGKYTRDPEIYPGLARARADGKCIYDGDVDGGSQVLFGAVLSPRRAGDDSSR